MRRIAWRRLEQRFPEFKRRVFVSPVNVSTARESAPVRIKLIGISHGSTPTAPMGIRTARIVRKELAQERGAILAEYKGRDFVPMRFLRRAKGMQAPKRVMELVKGYTFELPFGTYLGFALKMQLSTAKKYFWEFLRRVERIDGIAPTIAPSREMLEDPLVKKLSAEMKIPPEKFLTGLRLIVTARSLLMASEIAREAMAEGKKQTGSMSVITGASHMPEIEKFLSDPDLALRYTRMLKRAFSVRSTIGGQQFEIPVLGKSMEVFSALAEAEQVFTQLLQQNPRGRNTY